jgi:SAM-dependent methyltransferase
MKATRPVFGCAAFRAPACPLCGQAEGLTKLDYLRVDDLCREYRRQFHVAVRCEFPDELAGFDLLRCPSCGLEHASPLIEGSADFYAALSRSQAYYSRSRWEFSRAREFLDPTDEILDVGCGDGHFLSLLPHKVRQGVELNPEAAHAARSRGLDVRECTLESLLENSVDVITLFQVLEHVADPVALLCTAGRVLRPGGKLLIAVPNNDAFIGEAVHEPLNAPPHHPLRWTAAALEYLPTVLPFRLEALLREPLATEHLFHYRKDRVLRTVRRLTGAPLRRMAGNPQTVLVRKLVHLLVLLSLKMNRRPPEPPPDGHSLLAVYRLSSVAGNN